MSRQDNQLQLVTDAYTADVDLDLLRTHLRAERTKRKWSLDDLAEHSGVTRSAIHDVETNKKGKPRFETIAKLVEAMPGLTLSMFCLQVERLQSPSLKVPPPGDTPVVPSVGTVHHESAAASDKILVGKDELHAIGVAIGQAIAAARPENSQPRKTSPRRVARPARRHRRRAQHK